MSMCSTLARPARHGLLAALTVFMLLIGVGASYAVWSTTASGAGIATAAKVSLTQAASGTLVHSYGHPNAERSKTAGFTVTNTGTRTANYSLGVTASSSTAGLAGAITITTWVSTPTQPCTASATAPTGNSGVSPRTFTGASLAAGASVVLCVRTTITGNAVSAHAGKSLTIAVGSTVTAVRSDGVASTWSASSPVAQFAQKVMGETPAFDSVCTNGGTEEVLITWTSTKQDGLGLQLYADKQLVANDLFQFYWGPTLHIRSAFASGYEEGALVVVDVRDATGALVVTSTVKVQKATNGGNYVVPRCA